MSEQIVELAAVVLSVLIPIVAISFGIYASIRKKQSETELRRLIIENHTDLETAKALIEEQERKPNKSNKYVSLRYACVLIGLGVGAFADYLMHVEDKIYFWLIIAFGIGLGLLVSFIIELKLQKKESQEGIQQEPQQ